MKKMKRMMKRSEERMNSNEIKQKKAMTIDYILFLFSIVTKTLSYI